MNRDGAAIELQVLQYGVTRQRLSEVIRSGGGWDVVHLSGHGNRAGFALERPDGSMDYASTADLVDLLRPSLARLKLAVLASCKSAAAAGTDTLRLLGLPAQETGPSTGSAPDYAAGHVGGLAGGLAEELGCAVVATRYPVYDEFLTAFNQAFYERMLSGGEPAGMACARALAAVLAGASAGGAVSGGGSAVAVPEKAAPPGIPAATLGVFGASAAGLVLRAAPADPGPGGAGIVTAAERMAGFPHQAERFVGRSAETFLLLPVGTLPRAAAAILARELPALRALMFDGQPPALGRISPSGAGWNRVREALDRVQGHPGLLQLDDAAVSAQAVPLARGERERAERGIGEWAAATLAVLPLDAKLMASFVARVEPHDRRSRLSAASPRGKRRLPSCLRSTR